MKDATARKIYRKSYLFIFIDKISKFAESSLTFKKRDYLKGKKFEYSEILESSRVFRSIWSLAEKNQPRKGYKFFGFLATALFFLIFLFVPIKSWLKNFYPVESLYTFIVPVALVVIAVSLFLRGRTKKSEPNFNLVDLGILLFIFSLIISSVFSFFSYGQVKNVYYEGFIWLSYFAIFYIGRAIFYTRRALVLFLLFNLVIAFVLSGVGIAQYALGVTTPQWIEGYESIGTRVFSTLDNPIIFSGYINIFFFIALGIFFGVKRAWLKIFMFALFLIMLSALVLTFSRSGWIGFLAGVFFFFFLYKPKYILSLIPISIAFVLLAPQEYFHRFMAMFDGRYSDISAVSGRVWTLNNVAHILPSHLFFGVGPGMYGGEVAFGVSPSIVYMESIQGGAVPIQNTDNQFLQVLIQQGLVGILVFIFFTFACIYTGVAVYQKMEDRLLKMVALGITTAVFAFFVQGIFADVFQFPQMSLVMFGFLGILISLPKISSIVAKAG